MLMWMLIVLLMAFGFLFDRKPSKLPPGIWGLPFFGSLPSKHLALVEEVRINKKKYGDIFTWRIGRQIYVFLCDYELVKTALKKPEFSGRPPMYSADVSTNFIKTGVATSTGKLWHNNRRFALFHLKNLGMGKSSYESVIQREAAALVKDFEDRADKEPGPISWSLNAAILNVIWKITADLRYEVNDKKLHGFHELLNGLFVDIPRLVLLYDLIPWLYKVVPDFINRWCGIDEYKRIYTRLLTFFKDIIQDHKKTLDPNDPRDFIDQYMIEMEKQKGNPDSTMDDLNLLRFVLDFFIAGSETTSSTIRWVIFYLAKYPEIQKKVQDELDSIIDRKDLPSSSDRASLPYLDAVLHEVQRIVSLVGLSLPHAATEDTYLKGYFIPKGTIVMPNLDHCHRDPALWKKPDEFYPENFLDDEGNLVKGKEGFVPFSTGRRACLGENLANMELYLFMAALLQKFSFIFPEGEDLSLKRNPNNRLINACKPYSIIIKTR